MNQAIPLSYRVKHWFGRWGLHAYNGMEWGGPRWFNLSAPAVTLYSPWGHISLRLWNVFNRRSTDGHFWGLGILQVNNRHLFAVMFSGVSIVFVGRIP